MQLTHLGQRYTASSTSIDTIEASTELQFMGRSFKRRVPTAIPAQPAKQRMTYRGKSYWA